MQIGPYTVDGYDEETHTVYEFYGCYWHGCPTCHPELETQTHPHRSDCTYGALNQQTLIREHQLREQGYEVVTIWEHDFDQEIKNNPNLEHFLQTLNFQDPLNPRQALYGGRIEDQSRFFEILTFRVLADVDQMNFIGNFFQVELTKKEENRERFSTLRIVNKAKRPSKRIYKWGIANRIYH